MFVVAGFIVGFDTETDGVADEMVACIEEAQIPICTISELTALPNTQLWRRLEQEGRLHDQVNTYVDGGAGDKCTGGLNFVTTRPRRDILVDYKSVLERIYEPAAFFSRLRFVGRNLARARPQARVPLSLHLHNIATVIRLVWWIVRHEGGSRRRFVQVLADCLRNNSRAIDDVVSLMMVYLHVRPFSRYVIDLLDREIAMIDSGQSRTYEPVAAPAAGRSAGSIRAVGRRATAVQHDRVAATGTR